MSAVLERAPSEVASSTTSVAPSLAWDDPIESAETPPDDLSALLETQFVESAARRRQNRFEAAAPVTVLTREEIRESGAASIPEALRRAVGVSVIQNAANAWAIGMRGFNATLSNRVVVYIDGRLFAEISFGSHFWADVPVHIEEVERIEVLRGPSATLYGANAISGVVNVITRRPIDAPGAEGAAEAAVYGLSSEPSRASKSVYENGGRGYVGYNWVNAARTLGVRTTLGVGRVPEWSNVASATAHGQFNYRARLVVDHRPSEDVTLFGALDHAAAEWVTVTSAASVSSVLLTQDQTASFGFEDRSLFEAPLTLTVRAGGRRVVLEALSAVSATEVVETQTNQWSGDLLAQLDWVALDQRNTLTVLGEGRVQNNSGFVNGSASFLGVALQDELALLRDRSLILNAGARLELVHSQHGDSRAIYRNLNPRGAVIYRIAPEHALRVSVATAYRTPTAYETFALITQGAEAAPVVVGNASLRPETVVSGELGWVGRFGGVLELESALFAQRLSHLILNRLEVRTPIRNENRAPRDQLGLEASAVYRPSESQSLRLRYTLTRSVESEGGARDPSWPMHLFGASVGQRIHGPVRFDADFNYVSPIERLDLALTPATGTLALERGFARAQYLLGARLTYALGDGLAEVYLTGRNLLGFARGPGLLRQQDVFNAHPIGGELAVGLFVRGL